MRWVWWATAPIAVAAMFAASSQSLVDNYLPWSWSKEQVIEAGSAGQFSLPATDTHGNRVDTAVAVHAARVEVLGVQIVEPQEVGAVGFESPEGFDTWLVMTQWEAPADSILRGCNMWFSGSDGREYPRTDAPFSAPPMDDLSMTWNCVPPSKEGPGFSFEGNAVEPGLPRPEQWRKIHPVALPKGERPELLHVGWDTPDYVTLVLPEPANFLSSPSASGE